MYRTTVLIWDCSILWDSRNTGHYDLYTSVTNSEFTRTNFLVSVQA